MSIVKRIYVRLWVATTEGMLKLGFEREWIKKFVDSIYNKHLTP